MQKLLSLLFVLSLIAGACAKNGIDPDSLSTESSKGTCYNPGISSFGSDFQAYLNQTSNSDLTGFGGSISKTGDCLVTKQPVIFLHGNGDDANGSALGSLIGGWKASRDYFISKGYKPTELYAVNFGLAGVVASGSGSNNYHSPSNISKIYRFILAVKNYTGASKVDIISHSLGVTSARRAIKGGSYCDSLSCVNLGSSLNSYVDAFVGIAGGNRGLNSCGSWPLNVWTPTCGPHGFSINNPFLKELNGGSAYAYLYWGIWKPNKLSMKTGSYTYSIKSFVDELTCAPSMPVYCYVYSAHTSQLDGENGSKTYYSFPYGHFGLKNNTASVQYNMVANHSY